MFEKLNSNVTISRQFLRSVNLEADLGRTDALQGYICQDTAKSLVKNMAHHLNNTRQKAFTWTGPYGGGKSSLAIVLCSLVSPLTKLKTEAKKLLQIESFDEVELAFGSSKVGWLVLPVVGKRDSAINAISNALDKATGTVTKKPKATGVIERLTSEASKRKTDGVLLLIDELGKFLESAAHTGEDIHFYQELAEAASRCEGKLVVVGILHQAFEQYAIRLGREARDEWAKVQGRYVDIPLVTGTDEVIELVGRAISKKNQPNPLKLFDKFSSTIANAIIKRRPNAPANIKKSLLNCWPLHPVTAALLGPISRKRFSQNERSVFGFLASAEPLGFTDFLKSMPNSELALYGPARYWDYLTANMEQSILASTDGHRWAAAKDAIERTEAKDGCTEIHIQLSKTIALIDMFRSGSGLAAEDAVIETCIENANSESIHLALRDLSNWSILVFRKHIDSWAIFSGSDFDIDASISEARNELGDINIRQLIELSELNPIVAKRHYHLSGTLRWYTRALIEAKTANEYLEQFSLKPGAAGEFILFAPSAEFSIRQNKILVKTLSEKFTKLPIVIGFAQNSAKVYEYGMELAALERVQKSRRELDGDAVARKEVNSRLAAVKFELSEELKSSFDKAEWYKNGIEINRVNKGTLSFIASNLADETYFSTPYIQNELVNHETISGNSVKARKLLMYRMLNRYGESRLGYEGFSSDAGLFYSIIEANQLYQWIAGKWVFNTNEKQSGLGGCFTALWKAADSVFKEDQEAVTLTKLYEVWQSPPIGAKKGVLPLFALIYFLANRQHLGLYIENTFIPDLTEAYLDEWMQDTNRVAFKFVEIGEKREVFLRSLSTSLAKSLGKQIISSPLESARGLVNLIATLPGWSKRTTTVSVEAQRLRVAMLKANDPIKVLFSDLPNLLNPKNELDLVEIISNLTKELQNAYPKMLDKFREILNKALDNNGDIEELNIRAESIKGISGDFGVDAFVARLSVYKGDVEGLEGLLSTTINKNPKDWVDRDLDAAINALGATCNTFRKVESLNSLRNKKATRNSFSFVYADPKQQTISQNFDISNDKLPELKVISTELLKNLKKKGLNQDEILAIFAEACSETINIKG
jgi:hypothetical protein